MALINCPECNNMVSDKATTCPHCGCPISQSGKGTATLTVTMAAQWFLVGTTVTVALDGRDIGVIGDGQSVTTQVVRGQHTVLLSAMFRKCELPLNIDGDVRVDAKWNRLTGAINATAFPA